MLRYLCSSALEPLGRVGAYGDVDRLMLVDGEHSDTELQLRGGSSEVCEHLQAGGGGLVVRPQRVVPQLRTADGEIASNPGSRPAVMPSPRMRVEVFTLWWTKEQAPAGCWRCGGTHSPGRIRP